MYDQARTLLVQEIAVSKNRLEEDIEQEIDALFLAGAQMPENAGMRSRANRGGSAEPSAAKAKKPAAKKSAKKPAAKKPAAKKPAAKKPAAKKPAAKKPAAKKK